MTFKTFLISLGSTLAAASIALACDSSAETDSPESVAKPVASDSADSQEAQLKLRALGDSARQEYSATGGGIVPGPAGFPESLEVPDGNKCYDFSFETSDQGQRFSAKAVPKKSCAGAPQFSVRGSVQDGLPKISRVTEG